MHETYSFMEPFALEKTGKVGIITCDVRNTMATRLKVWNSAASASHIEMHVCMSKKWKNEPTQRVM